MGHDVSTGIIEFIMDHFTEENEGTFTCQITDGGGKGQSSLVLIGDGKSGWDFLYWLVVKQCINQNALKSTTQRINSNCNKKDTNYTFLHCGCCYHMSK